MLNVSDYKYIDFSHCPDGYVEKVFEYAATTKHEESLRTAMEWLNKETYFGQKCGARVYKDFAPYSFGFSLVGTDGRAFMGGGIIYHGSHDGGGNGGGPTFSVWACPLRRRI
jgi:hypothetical protein